MDLSAMRKRPFGMPDIDNGDVGEMLNQVIPFANQVNRQNDIRQQEMMRFENTLKNPRPRLSMRDAAYGATTPGGATPMGGTVSGPSSPGGNFSPMQRMFQQRDEEDKENRFKAGQMAADRQGKLTQAMEEGRIRDTGAMQRLASELNTRREINAEDNASREKVSQAELAARVKAAETERASRTTEGNLDRASREKVAGMPARATTPNATQQGNLFENRVQQLAVENPEAHALITKNADTGQFEFKGGTPAQQEWVRNYLKQDHQPQAPAAQPNAPKMITQRNKRTGETRQVPVK